MGRRDYRNKETKKPKKDVGKKSSTASISPLVAPPSSVEVVKRGKKGKPGE